jgi:hypothetical protein
VVPQLQQARGCCARRNVAMFASLLLRRLLR